MTRKQVIQEIFWLSALVVISLFLSYGLFTRLTNLSASGDFRFHDTYIIIEDFGPFSYFTQFFFLLLFITYAIKEAFRRYQNLLANGIFIVGAACTLVLKAYFVAIPIWLIANNYQTAATSGWSPVILSGHPQFNLLENIETIFYTASTILLLSIIAMIVRVVYLIKKQKAV